MQLTVTFNPDSADDVNAAIATLHKFVSLEQREATFTRVQLPAVALDKLDDPSVGAEPHPEKRKPGRPKKEQPQQEAAQAPKEGAAEAVGKPEVISAPTTDSSVTATISAPPQVSQATTGSLTLDDVRSALQKYTQKHSIEAGIELLKKFGAQRVSELAADRYAEFVGGCA